MCPVLVVDSGLSLHISSKLVAVLDVDTRLSSPVSSKLVANLGGCLSPPGLHLPLLMHYDIHTYEINNYISFAGFTSAIRSIFVLAPYAGRVSSTL